MRNVWGSWGMGVIPKSMLPGPAAQLWPIFLKMMD